MTSQLDPSALGVDLLKAAMSRSRARIIDLTRNPTVVIRFDQLVEHAEQAAHHWRDLGVGPGTAVVLACGTNADFIKHFIALTTLGAVPVAASHLASRTDLETLHRLFQPVAALFSARRNGLGSLQEIPSPFDDGLHVATDPTNAERPVTLPGRVIMMSSGSTGMPKAIVHSLDRILLNARLHAASVEYEPGGRLLLALSAVFSYGLVAGILAALQSDKDIVIMEPAFVPGSWHAVAEREPFTLFCTTPFLLRQLQALGRPFPSSLRKLTVGGDRVLAQDLQRLRGLYQGRLFLTYGLSEAGPRVFTKEVDWQSDEPPDAGRPLEGVQVRLHEPELVDGVETGELLVQTPTAMLGCLREAVLDRSDFIDGWLRTHDIFRRDLATDTYRFLERRKNVIVSGGEKLAAGHIRQMLLRHPAVAEAMVKGEPEADLGQIPVAELQLRQGVDPVSAAELSRWCRQHLRSVEVPRKFRFVESLHAVNK
jgi:long-chain acyl-CoA synthetase